MAETPEKTVWTEADLEDWSWHDAHIHSFALAGKDSLFGDLTLDIDFITQWDREGDRFLFHVAPATLVFHDIYDLVVDVDFARVRLAMGPLSIDGIEREPGDNPLVAEFRYCLPVNDPSGSIRFVGNRFTMTLRKAPVVQHGQRLKHDQRTG